GSGWIIIRAADLAALPEGQRVSPQNAPAMPKLLTSINNTPALRTLPGAHHYRLVGLEIGPGPAITMMGDLVRLGDSSSAQATLASVPHNIIIDRCYIHGSPQLPLKRGVALNSAWTAVIDSYISDAHVVGQDTQAICGWNGPGPFKIVNNYLEAAGENVMFGGAATTIPDLVPSDIEIRRNHFYKPLSWRVGDPSYAGIHWTVKNIFELKTGRRVLVEGNTFENCWLDAQTGYAINLKTSNQDSGQAWAITEDVMFINNIVRHAAGGVTLLGRSQPETGNTRRIRIANNLFEDISNKWGNNGRLFQVNGPISNLTIDHNTCMQTSNLVSFSGGVNDGFVFTNNIAPHNTYGVKGDGQPSGTASLLYYAPGYLFARNVIAGAKASVYPANNYYPATLDEVRFVDLAGGDYRLREDSSYKNAGTDGKDIGADLEAIQQALSGGQQAPPPNQEPYVRIAPSIVSGVAPLEVTFNVTADDPDGEVVSYYWSFGDGGTSNAATPTHRYETPGAYTAQVIITDNSGATASDAVTITVSSPPPNQPPQVSISASSQSGAAPLTVNFAANALDPDGQIVAYNWVFGDGQVSSEISPAHVYQTPGTFVARLVVTDNAGATASASVTITASAPSPPPTVSVLAPNQKITLSAGDNYQIEWKAMGNNLSRHDIHLSLDNGSTWQYVITGLPGSSNTYMWRVPATPTQNARIRVISYDVNGRSGADVSDSPFMIRKSNKWVKSSIN
ncbi:MAG TPA: PKD domain-containing protein, partial [Blastocatellia bacterium]|nr:PKD domain-containing protein [Blastocatellia bacterium]